MVKISEGKKGGGHFFLEAIERLNITEGGSLIISYLSLCRTGSGVGVGAYSRLGA